jgi:hypothetical protein
VIEPRTQALLQEILRREGRSLMLYVWDAYPWTAARGEPDLAELRKLIRAEAEGVAGLGQYLVRRRVPLPVHEPYPVEFTAVNFIALDYLLPRLAEAERDGVAALERDLAGLRDPEARAEVERLLAVKRANLSALATLAAGRTESTPA